MKIVKIPQKLLPFFAMFRNLFRIDRFEQMRRYILGLIVLQTDRSMTQLTKCYLAPLLRQSVNHFLLYAEIAIHQLVWRSSLWLLCRIIRLTQQPLYIIFDDTLIPKRGKTMFGVGKFKPGNKYIIGNNVVVGLFYIAGWTIPFGFRLYLKEELCKKLKRPFFTKHQLVLQLLAELKLSKDIKPIILFDSFYFSHSVVIAIKQRDWLYVSVAKYNRKIINPFTGRKIRLGNFIKIIQRKRKRKIEFSLEGRIKRYRVIQIKTHLSKVGEVNMVFSYQRGISHPLVLVTNDLKLPAVEVVRWYSLRWKIECFFQDIKQELGFGDYHTTQEESISKHLGLSILGYHALVFIRYRHRKNPRIYHRLQTIRGAKEYVREQTLRDTVSWINRRLQTKAGRLTLERLLFAA